MCLLLKYTGIFFKRYPNLSSFSLSLAQADHRIIVGKLKWVTVCFRQSFHLNGNSVKPYLNGVIINFEIRKKMHASRILKVKRFHSLQVTENSCNRGSAGSLSLLQVRLACLNGLQMKWEEAYIEHLISTSSNLFLGLRVKFSETRLNLNMGKLHKDKAERGSI